MNRGWHRFAGIALLVAGCGHTPEPPLAPPRLVIEEEVFDAGRVQQGESLRHQFRVRNAGGRELRLSSVRAACDCAADLLEPRALAANATGSFEVTLATTDLAGDIERTVTLFSNDPERQSAKVVLRARVAADVLVEPRQLYLGPISRGALSEATLQLSFPEVAQARATDAKSRGWRARPLWLDAGTSGKRRLAVRIAEDAPIGPFEEIIAIRTSHPRRKTVEVKVAGVVVDREEMLQVGR